MEFHELLNDLIEKHNIRSADICSKAGLNRAYVSKVRNGGFVPSEYQTVLDMANVIGLNSTESIRLFRSYQEAKAPEHQKNALKCFNAFYQLRPPSSEALHYDKSITLKNGIVISGKENVLKAVMSLSESAKQSLMLYVTPYQNPLKKVCETVCLTTDKNIPIKWLTLLDTTERGHDLNLVTFINMLSIYIVHDAQIRSVKGDIDFLNHSTAFPFFMVSEQGVLLLNADADSAMYLDSQEAVSLYSGQFAQNAERAVPFLQRYNDAETFLKDTSGFSSLPAESENDSEMYVIKRTPCLVMESSTVDIYNYIADIENADKIAESYIQFLGATSEKLKKIINCFPEDGLDSYLYGEEFYEISRHLTKTIPIELRRKLLQNFVEISKTDAVVPYMLRLQGFQESSLYMVNIWKDGRMLLMYDFDDKYYIFTAFDKDIADSVIDYIQAMKKCGILRSKEESVQIIRNMLAEKNE